jgi:hypothetical protein
MEFNETERDRFEKEMNALQITPPFKKIPPEHQGATKSVKAPKRLIAGTSKETPKKVKSSSASIEASQVDPDSTSPKVRTPAGAVKRCHRTSAVGVTVPRGDKTDPEELIASITSADAAKSGQPLPKPTIVKVSKNIQKAPFLPFQGCPIENRASEGNEITKIDDFCGKGRPVFMCIL